MKAAIFALALALRLLFILQIRDTAAGSTLLGDSESYDQWARTIAGGDWIGSGVFYQAPLYPYFLAVIYAVAGPSVLAVRVVQAILGSLACVMLAAAGERLFNRRAGIAAGLLMAMYPISIYFDGLIQKTVLDGFLLAALLLLIAIEGPPLALGVVAGLLGLVRENALILVPLLCIWFIWHKRARAPALVLLGVALVLVPVGIRNAVAGGDFQLTTYQFGSNFFIGNNEKANGMYVPLTEGGGHWRREREDAVRIADAGAGRRLSPREVSRYWTGRALDYIREHPRRWLGLMVRKLALVWNRVEIGDTESPYLFADAAPVLRALLPVWHFGILAPLAAAGIALTWRDRRRLWILYAMLIALTASIVVFYVFGRYRYSLVPILMLFAGAAIAALLEVREARLLVPAVIAVIAVALLANRTIVNKDEIVAESYFNLAWKIAGENRGDGDLVQATALYQRSLEAWPRFPNASNNLGLVLLSTGHAAEAKRRFAEAAAGDPGHVNSRINLARALAAEGRTAEAIQRYEETLRLRPGALPVHEELARLLFTSGKAAEAVPHYEVVAASAPSAAAHSNLGSALAQAGRLDEAIAQFEQALRLDPAFEHARTNLALARHLIDQTDGR